MISWVLVCGVFSILFGVFHLLFWRLFDWKQQLQKLSVPNRAIMQILNLCLTYVFFFIGFLCLAFPQELVETNLGKAFMIGCSLFWLARTVEQFIFLRINNIKVHLLTALFIVGTIIFMIPVLA